MDVAGVTEKEIEIGLREMGLREGDHVVVHTSLRKVGYIAGGPEAMLSAFLNVVGLSGTVAVPTYTYSYADVEGSEPFDRKNSPGRGVGIFSETVRQHPKAVRSNHPTHSVAAIGERAREFMAGHERVSMLGIDSPFHRIALAGGHVLLVGVSHIHNSSAHIGEVLAGVPYAVFDDWGRRAKVLTENGEIALVPVQAESPGCSHGFNVLDGPLRKRGAITCGRIGGADCLLMRCEDLLKTVCGLLADDPAFLLCTNPGCARCVRRRAALATPRSLQPGGCHPKEKGDAE